MAGLEEVLSACQDRKREGDLLFGRGKFEEAAAVYLDADDLLQLGWERIRSQPDGAALAAHKVGVMRMILLQNRAACCSKLELFAEAVELCTTALEHEPRAEQVLLQRGRCLQAMGNYVAAYSDFWDLSAAKPGAEEPKRQMQAIVALCPEAPEVRVRVRVCMLVCVGGWIRLCLCRHSDASAKVWIQQRHTTKDEPLPPHTHIHRHTGYTASSKQREEQASSPVSLTLLQCQEPVC